MTQGTGLELTTQRGFNSGGGLCPLGRNNNYSVADSGEFIEWLCGPLSIRASASRGPRAWRRRSRGWVFQVDRDLPSLAGQTDHFRVARSHPGIGSRRDDHFLQADFPLLIKGRMRAAINFKQRFHCYQLIVPAHFCVLASIALTGRAEKGGRIKRFQIKLLLRP